MGAIKQVPYMMVITLSAKHGLAFPNMRNKYRLIDESEVYVTPPIIVKVKVDTNGTIV